jgi:hypothetical protein
MLLSTYAMPKKSVAMLMYSRTICYVVNTFLLNTFPQTKQQLQLCTFAMPKKSVALLTYSSRMDSRCSLGTAGMARSYTCRTNRNNM